MENVTIKVEGMSCEHCVRAVSNAITGIAGTANVKVELKSKTASFSYDPARTGLEAIKSAIAEEGFTVSQ